MTDQYVADRIALQDVMSRYAKGVDDYDVALYESCFADDVEVVGFGKETFHGLAAWMAYWRKAMEPFAATQHMLGPQLATIDGDSAKCRTDVQAHHFLKEPEGTTLTLWATYEQDMARVDGEWKITRHSLISRGTRMHPG
jgi:ketosteroid isomerase-like protein